MRRAQAKINITECLRLKTMETSKIYLTYLNKYFQQIYPTLKIQMKTILRKKDLEQEYNAALDHHSLQYLKEECDYRKDILDFEEAMS